MSTDITFNGETSTVKEDLGDLNIIRKNIAPTHLLTDNHNIYSVYLAIRFLTKLKFINLVKFNVKVLKKMLNVALWTDSTIGNVNFSPKTVIENPTKYRRHYERIQKADLSYPIIVSEDTHELFDGAHRLSKAVLNKIPTINGYIIPNYILRLCKIDDSRNIAEIMKKITHGDLDRKFDEGIKKLTNEYGIIIN